MARLCGAEHVIDDGRYRRWHGVAQGFKGELDLGLLDRQPCPRVSELCIGRFGVQTVGCGRAARRVVEVATAG